MTQMSHIWIHLERLWCLLEQLTLNQASNGETTEASSPPAGSNLRELLQVIPGTSLTNAGSSHHPAARLEVVGAPVVKESRAVVPPATCAPGSQWDTPINCARAFINS